uniref:Uncharacterized protein n=1 Tax=Rangifer tarandus platyrhynchus TaxID=3082113 RepID=A0ACB0F426_RANTA|nr:unnamed protein product [Rangifer tarandus platyrhynchus]
MTSGENRTGRIHSRPSPGSPSHASSPLRATRAPIAQPRPRDPLSDPPAPPRARPHRLPSIPGAHSPGGAPQPLVTRPAPPPPRPAQSPGSRPESSCPGHRRGGASGTRGAAPADGGLRLHGSAAGMPSRAPRPGRRARRAGERPGQREERGTQPGGASAQTCPVRSHKENPGCVCWKPRRGEQSGGGEGGPGPGRAERATLRAFVSGGAEAAAAAGRPERRMRRRAARIEGRCGGRLRGARPGAWRDLCV